MGAPTRSRDWTLLNAEEGSILRLRNSATRACNIGRNMETKSGRSSVRTLTKFAEKRGRNVPHGTTQDAPIRSMMRVSGTARLCHAGAAINMRMPGRNPPHQ